MTAVSGRPGARFPGAVILAGGDSKRLGRPKALLDFCGRSLIERITGCLEPLFQQLTLVTDRPELFRGLPVMIISDLITSQGKSPLRGIHAGLSASSLPYQFVVACDMPFLNPGLIRHMAVYAAEYDAVVPRIGNYYQPLHAFYSRSCIEAIERSLQEGPKKVTDFYESLRICYLGKEEIEQFDPTLRSFVNINTRQDYETALKDLGCASDTRGKIE